MRQGPRPPQAVPNTEEGTRLEQDKVALAETAEGSPEEIRLGQDFFQVIVEYAFAASKITGRSFREACSHYTPLYNTLAREWPTRTDEEYAAARESWTDFITRVTPFVENGNVEEIARIAYEKYNRPGERHERPKRHFGCFSYSVQDRTTLDSPWEINIHFTNRDGKNGGPLSPAKIQDRKRDLYEMFKEVRQKYPNGDNVARGASWLYNLPRYRELFPDAYQDSLNRPDSVDSNRLQAVAPALWLQFLKADGTVNQDARKIFSERIGAAKSEEELMDAFPFKVLMPRAPAAVFFKMVDEYEAAHPTT